MNRAEVGQIVLCAIGSAGGIGAIIVCTVKWSANKIADRLSKKYEVKEGSQPFPSFTKDVRNDYEKYKPLHDSAADAIIIAQDEIRSSAPFISAELYEEFCSLEKLCKLQLSDFQDFRLQPDAKQFRDDCREDFQNTYKRTHEINECFNNLLENMRKYIAKLDVIE